MNQKLLPYSQMLSSIYDQFCLLPKNLRAEATMMLFMLQERLQTFKEGTTDCNKKEKLVINQDTISVIQPDLNYKTNAIGKKRTIYTKVEVGNDQEITAPFRMELPIDTFRYIPDLLSGLPLPAETDVEEPPKLIEEKIVTERPRKSRKKCHQNPQNRSGRPSVAPAEYWDAVKEHVELVSGEPEESLSEGARGMEHLKLDDNLCQNALNKENFKYRCKVCRKLLKSRIPAQTHMYNQHFQDLKPFSCDVCKKKFSTKTSLSYHKESHILQKNHLCHMCSHTTNSKSSLDLHIRTLHTEKQQFMCHICDFTTIHTSSLSRHIQVHLNVQNYRCKACDKSFNCSQKLSRHKAWHHSVRNNKYKCGICSKTFPQPNKLRQHESIHSGRKEFVCSECDYQCNTKSNLTKHQRLVHKIDLPMYPNRISVVNTNPALINGLD